jgi:hypothetical protein
MELRFLLKSGHSVALGVLALRAVQSALTLAMPTGGDSPPMGWTPMPDPADGGVGSPPFPVNLTAEERAHLEAFDVLDFEVFSARTGHDWVKATPPTSDAGKKYVTRGKRARPGALGGRVPMMAS